MRKQQSARDALDQSSNWLSSVCSLRCSLSSNNADVSQTGLWSRVAVATELGGILRTLGPRAPHGHRAFSELVFGRDSIGADLMSEGDIETGVVGRDEGEIRETGQSHTNNEQAASLGYLEDDDIEEW